MPWNSISPVGTSSVKVNRPLMQQNTAYTETTLNNDHFWNISGDQDGRHKFVNMPSQTNSGVVLEPTSGMNGVIYLKAVSSDNSLIQGYYNNGTGGSSNPYQFIPCFKSGTVVVPTSGYVTVVSVPKHSYGQIYFFRDDELDNMGFGFFKSGTATVQAYSSMYSSPGSSSASTSKYTLGYGVNASGLDIRVASNGSGPGTDPVQYRIVYWGI